MRYPARPEVKARYRGMVSFIPERCTGCGICKFRCTARAIEIRPGKGEFTWSYDPGQCTFCGRCVEGCKAHALSQDEACPPVYVSLGELKKSYTVARKPPVRKPVPVAEAPASAATEEKTQEKADEKVENPVSGGMA